ncbi:hypothetical protein PILCRDRAFT_825122 [Piloderma croceum F 1598]|uniref:Uncharacterized protein n=1 Tax=Piloderma croceum (strain F 1598) TaxID=765440 RepID=A0A0C3FCX6_PILCF|nr:hypothetical protein PILCRDRAFT_825122 [Piloderma croceum F 1598]
MSMSSENLEHKKINSPATKGKKRKKEKPKREREKEKNLPTNKRTAHTSTPTPQLGIERDHLPTSAIPLLFRLPATRYQFLLCLFFCVGRVWSWMRVL